jgi:hypothetical protein
MKRPQASSCHLELHTFHNMESGPERKIFKAAVINTSELVKSQSRDVGDARMTESKEDRSGNFLLRLKRRIWDHNLAQEWYRQREISRARKEILESGNLYAGEKDFDPDNGALSASASKEAMQAIIERFTSEYEDEMLKEGERESKEVIEGAEINNKLKDLIKQYARSSMTKAAFDEQKKSILSHYDKKYKDPKSLYADNLFEIATEVRDAVAQGTKLAELDFEVELTLGNARESLSTEAHHSGFDKGVERLQNSKLGKYIANEPAALGIAAGLYEVGRNTLQKTVRSKAAQWATFGLASLASGGISAMKENARVKRERAQHQRESAKGMRFEEGSKRREQMDENSYDTKKATMIIHNLTEDLERVKGGEYSEEQLTEMMGRLADLEARVQLNDQQKIDLISYDKVTRIERDRTTMDLRRAELKVLLRNEDQGFDAELESLVDVQKQQLMEGEGGIEQKDEVFNKLRKTRVRNAFIKSTLTAATIGTAFQEAKSFFDDSQDGVIEGGIKHFTDKESLAQKGTALEALRRYVTGEQPMVTNASLYEAAQIEDTHIDLPEGVTLVQNADSTFNFLRNDEVIAEHIAIRLDPDGSLDDETEKALAKSGITSTFGLIGEKTTETVHESVGDYVKNHAEGMQRIHRELWYDNDTPHPFDKNELRTDWGGQNGTGIDANGNYVFNVSRMTEDGSVHGSESVDVTKGGLKMLFSFSKDTQHQVFEVPIGPDGNAVIDPNSELGKLMFETNQDGHAVFTGKFAEVAQSMGNAPDGGENVRILGTHVGPGKEMVDDIVSTDTTVPRVAFNIPQENMYDVPPVIPVRSRRPLERGAYRKNREIEAERPQQPDSTEENPLPFENPTNEEGASGGEVIPEGGFRADIAQGMHYSQERGFEGQEQPIDKKTDHIYAYGVSTFNRAIVESQLKKDKHKHPEVLILENDRSNREKNLKEIAYLKKWYPKAIFTYVALPDRDTTGPVDKKEKDDYNIKRLAHILNESKVDPKKIKHQFIKEEKVIAPKPLGEVSGKEWDTFMKNGKVTQARLRAIAEKLKANSVLGSALSQQEQLMYLEQKEKVDKIIKK